MLTSHKWTAVVVGDEFDLDQIAESMSEGDPSLVKIGGEFILHAHLLSSCETVREARPCAEMLLKLITGISAAVLSSRTPITLGSLREVCADGKVRLHAELHSTMSVRASMTMMKTNPDGSVEISRQADPVQPWLQLALRDQLVAKAFRIMSEPRKTWHSLYNLYEIVKGDMGGDTQITEREWITKSTLERFTRTANSASAAGDFARHAFEKYAPPPVPMLPSEAEAMVVGLVHSWVRAKVPQ